MSMTRKEMIEKIRELAIEYYKEWTDPDDDPDIVDDLLIADEYILLQEFTDGCFAGSPNETMKWVLNNLTEESPDEVHKA